MDRKSGRGQGTDGRPTNARDDRVGGTIPLSRIEPAVERGFRPHFGWVDIQRSYPPPPDMEPIVGDAAV